MIDQDTPVGASISICTDAYGDPSGIGSPRSGLRHHGRMSENGIVAHGLLPPYEAMPRLEPMRRPTDARGRPVYVYGPQPEGTVRVVLDSAGCNGEPADFRLHDEHPTPPEPYRVFDVPQGQYERWRAAKESFGAMEEEIEGLVDERARVMHEQVRERCR